MLLPRLLSVLTAAALPALALAAPPPCVFCEIVAGTRQAESVVYRDDRCTAFLSIGARNPGHVLVVPNAHAENFMAVPAGTMHHLTDVAQVLIAAIQRTDLRCEGIMLQMNSGRSAGQSVFHAHLHVIPRYEGDGPPPAAAIQPAERSATGQAEAAPPPKRAGDPFPQDVLAPVAARIRTALAGLPPPARDPAATALVVGRGPQLALPPLGEEVPLNRIKAICAAYGLHELWRKIERDPPPRPFRSDGCTGWFDEWKGVSLYPAGFLHDLKYWAGYPGEDVDRLLADAELLADVARLLGSTEMAETMFHGVRVGGSGRLRTSFSWGFGRPADAVAPSAATKVAPGRN